MPWEDIKASELINKQQPAGNKNMTVGLHIYLFRIKTDKLAQIQDQIEQTNTVPVKYNDLVSFTANGLTGCGGDRKSWQKIGPLIAEAEPKTKKHINLLITENLSDDVVITETAKPVSIIYHSNDSTSGIGFDAGQMVLRLKVSSLIGLRQACRLDVMPVYKITGQESGKILSGEKKHEFTFDSAAFSVRLQPGRYVLIAPANERQKQTETQTIGNIISYRQTPEDIADLCLIACDLINNPL